LPYKGRTSGFIRTSLALGRWSVALETS
jgi:hypothetical protein